MKKQIDKEIYELTCDFPNCKKVIKSLSENQAMQNMKVHKLTHEVQDDFSTNSIKFLKEANTKIAEIDKEMKE